MTKLENKYQVAFNRLKNDIERGNCDYNVSPYLLTIQELVDKETPMKVNKIINKERVYLSDVAFVYSDVTLGKCPNCDTYLHEENEYGDVIDYCPYCGHRLDWSGCND